MRLADIILPPGARLVITLAPTPRPEGTVVPDPIRVELFSETEFIASADVPRDKFDEGFPELLRMLLLTWDDRSHPGPRGIP